MFFRFNSSSSSSFGIVVGLGGAEVGFAVVAAGLEVEEFAEGVHEGQKAAA